MTEVRSYVFEELTPRRMELVDDLMQTSARRGEIEDNRERKHAYKCDECGAATMAVDRNVGQVAHFIECPRCGKGAEDLGPDATRFVYKHSVKAVLEFYRPLTEDELDAHIDKFIEHALAAALQLDPTGEAGYMEKALDAEATRLINGHLRHRYV